MGFEVLLHERTAAWENRDLNSQSLQNTEARLSWTDMAQGKPLYK